jgi:hypothetical protein
MSSYDGSATVSIYVMVEILYDIIFYDRFFERIDLMTRCKRIVMARDDFLAAKVRSRLLESKESKASAMDESKLDFAESLDSVVDDAKELEMLRRYKKIFLASKVGDSTDAPKGVGAGAASLGKPSGLGLLSKW